MIERIVKSVRRSIRIQLITTFTACALLGVLSSKAATPFFENANREATIDYRVGMEQINREAQNTAEMMMTDNKMDAVQDMIEAENQQIEAGRKALKVLITDENGKVLYKTKQAQEEQINLHNTIRNAASFAINNSNYNFESARKEFIAFSPITIEDKNLYMFVSGIPEGEVVYETQEGPFPFLLVYLYLFSLSST